MHSPVCRGVTMWTQVGSSSRVPRLLRMPSTALVLSLVSLATSLVGSCNQAGCDCMDGGSADSTALTSDNAGDSPGDSQVWSDTEARDELVPPGARDDSEMDETPLETSEGPCIRVTNSPLVFPPKSPLLDTRTLPVIIESCSEAFALEIFDIQLSEDSAADFSLDLSSLEHFPSSDYPLIVPGGRTIELTLVYTPSDITSPQKGSLLIRSNADQQHTIITIEAWPADLTNPVAVITSQEGNEVVPQTVLHLDGQSSYSVGGVMKGWKWTVDQPDGSASLFAPADDVPDPTFDCKTAGIYLFYLDVWDALDNKSWEPDKYEVVVIPTEAVYIELLWKTPEDSNESDTGVAAGSDLDLHFAHPLASQPDQDHDGLPDPWFDTVYDCFWFNKAPDWGEYGSQLNDPHMSLADEDGAGPEIIYANLPESVTYSIGVNYWNDHSFGPAFAILRVYIFGNLVTELEGIELHDRDMWSAATLEWPSGMVHLQIDSVTNGLMITPDYTNLLFHGSE